MLPCDAECDGAGLVAVLDGVVHEVGDGLGELLGVYVDLCVWWGGCDVLGAVMNPINLNINVKPQEFSEE